MDPILIVLGLLASLILLCGLLSICRQIRDPYDDTNKRITKLILMRRLSEHSRSFSRCKSQSRSRSQSRSKSRSTCSSPALRNITLPHNSQDTPETENPPDIGFEYHHSEMNQLIDRYNRLKQLVPTPSLASSDSQSDRTSTPRVSFSDTPRSSTIETSEYPKNIKLTVINEITNV